MQRKPIVLSFLAIVLVAAAAPARGAEAKAADPRRVTLDTIREVGRALYYWAVDVAGEREAHPQADGKPREQPPTVRWNDCPAVTYEEARSLVVPRYLAELPRTDAWGNPLELCVDREGVKAKGQLVLGVRSAGADGKFDGNVYTVGAFDRAQLDHDLVWLDGYFIAWPQPQPQPQPKAQ